MLDPVSSDEPRCGAIWLRTSPRVQIGLFSIVFKCPIACLESSWLKLLQTLSRYCNHCVMRTPQQKKACDICHLLGHPPHPMRSDNLKTHIRRIHSPETAKRSSCPNPACTQTFVEWYVAVRHFREKHLGMRRGRSQHSRNQLLDVYI